MDQVALPRKSSKNLRCNSDQVQEMETRRRRMAQVGWALPVIRSRKGEVLIYLVSEMDLQLQLMVVLVQSQTTSASFISRIMVSFMKTILFRYEQELLCSKKCWIVLETLLKTFFLTEAPEFFFQSDILDKCFQSYWSAIGWLHFALNFTELLLVYKWLDSDWINISS